eukprot:COSAG01_NODE_7323_length_3251_cov_1.566624_3_plen_155_part_00
MRPLDGLSNLVVLGDPHSSLLEYTDVMHDVGTTTGARALLTRRAELQSQKQAMMACVSQDHGSSLSAQGQRALAGRRQAVVGPQPALVLAASHASSELTPMQLQTGASRILQRRGGFVHELTNEQGWLMSAGQGASESLTKALRVARSCASWVL